MDKTLYATTGLQMDIERLRTRILLSLSESKGYNTGRMVGGFAFESVPELEDVPSEPENMLRWWMYTYNKDYFEKYEPREAWRRLKESHYRQAVWRKERGEPMTVIEELFLYATYNNDPLNVDPGTYRLGPRTRFGPGTNDNYGLRLRLRQKADLYMRARLRNAFKTRGDYPLHKLVTREYELSHEARRIRLRRTA